MQVPTVSTSDNLQEISSLENSQSPAAGTAEAQTCGTEYTPFTEGPVDSKQDSSICDPNDKVGNGTTQGGKDGKNSSMSNANGQLIPENKVEAFKNEQCESTLQFVKSKVCEIPKENVTDSLTPDQNSLESKVQKEKSRDSAATNDHANQNGAPKDFLLKPPEDDDIGKKKRRAQLFLDIPSAQQSIPVLAVTPATGSIGHQSPLCGEEASISPNSCIQCLLTAKTVWTLLLTVLDQITDFMAIERFYRTGHIFFFVLSIIFYAFPILVMCTYATNVLRKKLEWTWLDCVLNYPLAPYWLILVNITNSLKNGRNHGRYDPNAIPSNSLEDILEDRKAMMTLHALEGTLEAIPQVYIQTAAYMAMPVTSRYDEVVARLPLTISVISASWSIVANLDVGTKNVFWGGIHRLFAATEVGVAMTTRAMVAGGLFLQFYPGLWEWIWLLPCLASIIVTWFTAFFSIRSFRRLLMPVKKALAIPPADLEGLCGLMPFLVTAMCLMPATYELLMYFIGFEFLAGLSWFCFTLPKEGNANIIPDIKFD
ncbi:hypothetical protein SK128_002284 [Halocaridina rubra]|uniref:XK-related protein n=1 Tax=Halocaridina rubra TaxID=373956 RepID=A0AAN8XAG2_HALRR